MNYKVFQALFEHLQPYASIMQYWKGKKTTTECAQPNLNLKVKKLSLEEEFLAVMIQLRCGFRHRDTARFFGISEAWFSCIFTTWICLLSDVLSDLCKFPSREVTKETMPPCFVDFPDTRIVLDCTEIFSQQASSTRARKQMFARINTMTHTSSWSELRHPAMFRLFQKPGVGGQVTHHTRF